LNYVIQYFIFLFSLRFIAKNELLHKNKLRISQNKWGIESNHITTNLDTM